VTPAAVDSAGNAKGTSPTGRALIGAIAAYRAVVSPWLGGNCRFHPNCSAYAVEAIEIHGAARGSVLAARRIARCHPWHPGGHDPVPARHSR
jgi:hypothetical protein